MSKILTESIEAGNQAMLPSDVVRQLDFEETVDEASLEIGINETRVGLLEGFGL
jgi:hypothetical protein